MINYPNNSDYAHSMATNQPNVNYAVQPATASPACQDNKASATTICELSNNFNNAIYLTNNKSFGRNKSEFVNNNNSINGINESFLMHKDTENVKRFSVNNLLQLANYSAGERNNLGKIFRNLTFLFI
jgi:hypothetical protein